MHKMTENNVLGTIFKPKTDELSNGNLPMLGSGKE
jgi:hypothetical protein